jgi:hypothetical protein
MTTEGQELATCDICGSQPSAWASPTGHDVCQTCLLNDFHRTLLEASEALSACRQQLDVIGDWIVSNDPVKTRRDHR